MTEKAQITRRSTMQEVLEAYPSAQRAVFQRYHIRGCNSCGYQPEDTLEQVAHNHNITDLDEASYFRAYDFPRARSLAGGLSAWDHEIEHEALRPGARIRE